MSFRVGCSVDGRPAAETRDLFRSSVLKFMYLDKHPSTALPQGELDQLLEQNQKLSELNLALDKKHEQLAARVSRCGSARGDELRRHERLFEPATPHFSSQV